MEVRSGEDWTDSVNVSEVEKAGANCVFYVCIKVEVGVQQDTKVLCLRFNIDRHGVKAVL